MLPGVRNALRSVPLLLALAAVCLSWPAAAHAELVIRETRPLAATASFEAAAFFDATRQRTMDRFSQFAVFAANQAVAASQGALTDLDPERAGVFVGNGMGGTLSMDAGYQTFYGERSDRVKPFTILLGMTNAAAAWVGMLK